VFLLKQISENQNLSFKRQLLLSESLAVIEQIKNLRIGGKPLLYHSPLLFHGTSLSNAEKIIESGFIKPGQTEKAVCFSELDVPEIERLRMKRMDIAFAFLRKEIRLNHPESFGEDISFKNATLKSLYTQAQKEIPHLNGTAAQKFLEQLAHYVPRHEAHFELKEYRVLEPVPVKNCLWILVKDRDFPAHPHYQKFRKLFSEKYGPIHYSFWNQEHMRALIEEPQYVTFQIDEKNKALLDFSSAGDFYAKKHPKHYPLHQTGHFISFQQETAFETEYNALSQNNSRTPGQMNLFYTQQLKVKENSQPIVNHLWPMSHYQVSLTLYHLLKKYGSAQNRSDILNHAMIDYSNTVEFWEK
jgi:hypothetical protein